MRLVPRVFDLRDRATSLWRNHFEYLLTLRCGGGELASWGEFKPDDLPIERLAELAPQPK